jgi:tetratricopeptide (TPR) repeat protein
MLAGAAFGLAFTLASCSSGSSSTPSGTPAQLLNQGLVASKAGNYGQAATYFNQVVIKDSNNAKNLQAIAYYNLGVIYQQQGLTDKAISNFKLSLALDPTYPPANFDLAIALTPSDPQQALSYYNKILAVNPKDANSLFNSGLLMYAAGDTADGAARIKQAIAITPSLAARVPSNVNLG